MRRESRPNWSKFKNYPFVWRSMEGAKRGETRFTQTGTANKTPCLGVTLWEETTSEMQNIAPIQNPERIRAMSIIPHESSVHEIGQGEGETRDKEHSPIILSPCRVSPCHARQCPPSAAA